MTSLADASRFHVSVMNILLHDTLYRKKRIHRDIHYFSYLAQKHRSWVRAHTICIWSKHEENITKYKAKNDIPRAINALYCI